MIHTVGAAVFEFGGFRLEPQRRLLSRDGEPVVLTDKAFDALAYLVEHAGQLVTKDDLMRALWPDVIVEENNLYVVISTLRRALKDESTAQRLIATVAGRGYQFVADVQVGAISAEKHVPAPSATPVLPIPSPWYSRLSNRRIAWLSAAMLLLAIGIVAAVVALRPASAPASVVTLAVLPFKPLTPADRNESLEFGMAETLIAGLNADRLSVSPLSSVRRFAGSEQDVLAAGRALGVQAVLEGHIQRVNGELRVPRDCSTSATAGSCGQNVTMKPSRTSFRCRTPSRRRCERRCGCICPVRHRRRCVATRRTARLISSTPMDAFT